MAFSDIDEATRKRSVRKASETRKRRSIAGKKKRPCITCARPFWSAGAHNRMCDPCRSRANSDWMSDIDTGLAVGGAKLPWETYFTYGTPSPLSLAEHQKEYASAGPAAEAAEEAIPDPIDESRAVANAPV